MSAAPVMIPLLKCQYSVRSNAMGLMLQARSVKTDVFATFDGVSGFEQSGIWLEKNTGSMILQPDPIPRDFGTAAFGSPTGGKWKESLNRSSAKKQISQYDATAGVTWKRETVANFLDLPNHPFSLTLSLGPCPKDGVHTAADYYRHIIWPSDAAAGENIFRVSFTYAGAPTIERTTDGAAAVTAGTAVWTDRQTIPCPVDMGALRRGKNVEVTLSVMALSGKLVVWLGQDLNNETRSLPGQVSYNAGKIRLEGKNGIMTADFSDLRFAAEGTFVTPRRPGPIYIEKTPIFRYSGFVNPDYNQSITGAIVERFKATKEYTYQVSMESDRLSSDPSNPLYHYSASTPILDAMTIEWPAVYRSSPPPGWTDIPDVKRYEGRWSFDIASQVVSSNGFLTVSNDFGEWIQNRPNQTLRIFTGWAHTGYSRIPRMVTTANTEGEWNALSHTSEFTFKCEDLLERMAEMPIRDKIVPGGWCVYALVHQLTEIMGLTPEVTRFIPDCEPGPRPQCNHTKFPKAGIKWEPLTPGLSCLNEVQRVEGAVMGTAPTGHFLFYRFRPESPYRISAVYNSEGSNARYSHLDGIVAKYGGVKRYSSSKGIRNDWTLIGIDQATGNLFSVHDQNWHSIYNRLAPNYRGTVSPLIRAWSGYTDPEFAAKELARIAYWSNLPSERVRLPVLGQPGMFPLAVFRPRDARTVGFGSDYYLIDHLEIYDKMRSGPALSYDSLLNGAWTGRGILPGWG